LLGLLHFTGGVRGYQSMMIKFVFTQKILTPQITLIFGQIIGLQSKF